MFCFGSCREKAMKVAKCGNRGVLAMNVEKGRGERRSREKGYCGLYIEGKGEIEEIFV